MDLSNIDDESGCTGSGWISSFILAAGVLVSVNLFLPQRVQHVHALQWSMLLLLALMFQDVTLLGATPTLLDKLLNELL